MKEVSEWEKGKGDKEKGGTFGRRQRKEMVITIVKEKKS